MKINRITPLMLGGLLLSQGATASTRNVSYVKVDATALSDANATRTDQLSRVLSGLQMGNSGSLIFQSVSLRGISSAQDFYNQPSLSMWMACPSSRPSPCSRCWMWRALRCCAARRARCMTRAPKAGSSTSSPTSRTARRGAMWRAARLPHQAECQRANPGRAALWQRHPAAPGGSGVKPTRTPAAITSVVRALTLATFACGRSITR